MSKPRLLITGADGFLGSHIVPAIEDNFQIHELVNDLRNHTAVSEEVQSFQPDLVLHLAARTEVEQSFYEQVTFSDINYTGTVNLIECVKQHCPDLSNFIFASTMEVYGWQPISDQVKHNSIPEYYQTFTPDTIPNPNAPYAVAKYGCEKYLEYARRSYGMPSTILRQTNCYGRKDNDFFVVEQIISQMLTNSTEINLGYAEPYRNFIYVDDMIAAWKTVIENTDKVKNNLYTIGPDSVIKIRDLVQLIADKIGWNGQVNWDQKPERPGEIYWLNSNNALITEHTGWEPVTTLDRGLDLTIEHWREKLSLTNRVDISL